jgi:hypothetical protein
VTPAPDETGDRYLERLAIGMVIIGIAARVIAIGRLPGINADEAWYGVNVNEFLDGARPFLQTGVGNPINPLHSGLLLALSAIASPSIALLRAPEVILGMLTVMIAWPLLRRPLGERAALLSTILIAISPAAIAYSRLGWDPSGSPLITLLAIGCALNDRPGLTAISQAGAYLVHPTNVFVAPMVAAAWAPHAVARFKRTGPRDRKRLLIGVVALISVAMPAVIWALVRIAHNPDTSLPSTGMVVERAFSVTLWMGRAWGAVNLVSGVTTAIAIGGPMPGATAVWASAIVSAVLVATLALAMPILRMRAHASWLLAGIAATFAGFHLVAIDAAFNPGLERYAMSMLVPLLIVSAIAIDAALQRAAVARVAAILLMVTMIAVTAGGYFYPLAARGGDSAAAYRTGAVEPKLAAYRFIEGDSGNADVSIVAEDWWLYWPLRYFAGKNDRIAVAAASPDSIPGGLRPAGASAPPIRTPSITYLVAFAGSALPGTLTRSASAFQAVDPIGRVIVEVFRIERSENASPARLGGH